MLTFEHRFGGTPSTPVLNGGLMQVLGIESSCDETAAAIVEDAGPGFTVRSDVVSSQVELHAAYGGVVPEVASRHHLTNIAPVVAQALALARTGLEALDGIAVTRGPGLIGALLVGVQFGKALAYARGLPLVGVNHLEGHLTSVFLQTGEDSPLATPGFPHVALLCSGGHTEIHLVHDFGQMRLLGATRDDAAGEAFDKGGKMLGLGYPGGVKIEALAHGGDPGAIKFPRSFRGSSLEFSFSGLKTALAIWLRDHGRPEGPGLADLCASYQAAIIEVLVDKVIRAAELAQTPRIVLAGGVAANKTLQQRLREEASVSGCELFVPPLAHCTDNAGMIAAAGLMRLRRGERAGLDLNADASLALG